MPVLATAAQRRPLYVVPADDAVLASMVLASKGPSDAVVLFDPRDENLIAGYVGRWEGPIRCLWRAGTSAALVDLLKAASGGACTTIEDAFTFARAQWPQARAAIVVPATDYRWLLHAAAFAGATGAALIPLETGALLTTLPLRDWKLETIYVTPPAAAASAGAGEIVPRVVNVADTDALVAELLRLRQGNAPTTLVIANPLDRESLFSPAGLSLLAPMLAAVRGAPLLLTSSAEAGAIEDEAQRFIDRHRLPITHIILVGDELALRSHRVADPVRAAGGAEARGGGIEVRVELFSQIEREEPQDYAVGRIVAESASQASVNLARQLHRRAPDNSKKPVIFLANADQIFALGETISRTTASEVRNVGLPVKAYYRDQITPDIIQKALKQTDVLVWEGHPRDLTLEEYGGIAVDAAPSLVVLQGCYTLDRSDPFILFEKGTEAIVATSAAIYSASGSAFARALFDGLLYEHLDLGTAVRNARNFLLALTKLKKARGHADWRKTYRAALAFALWGDPTAHAPLQAGRPTIAPAVWSSSNDALSLTIPSATLREETVSRYRAKPVPRAMLGSLLLRDGGAPQRHLKELYFTVQSAPSGVDAAASAGVGWDVISLFAPHTRTLTVLARPDWHLAQPRSTYTFPLLASGTAQ